MRSTRSLPYFAATAPGLEPLALAELKALGTGPVRLEPGGVSFGGPQSSLMRANLWLRTASRVHLRLATFHAEAFYELERHARSLPWARYIAPGATVRFAVSCQKSRLYHTGAIAERLFEAIARTVPAVEPAAPSGAKVSDERDDEESGAGPLVFFRAVRDECTVGIDSSGDLLHRRGWRRSLSRAPLRETLAAALLLAAGYDGSEPLCDPLCGSGTIPIEAALIAKRAAPGLGRHFAFEAWEGFEQGDWEQLRQQAKEGERRELPAPIEGSDSSASAINAAKENAERAGLAGVLQFQASPFQSLAPREMPGLIAGNPPYGRRIGEESSARPLLASFVKSLECSRAGWRLALIAPPALLRTLRPPLKEMLSTRNGGLQVALGLGNIPQRP